ncbi:MAG: hypothetical protein JXR43_02850 [Burkholderiaceae bacterium]|nr:hypothetical protein [Burkholderiaceae bacterium]
MRAVRLPLKLTGIAFIVSLAGCSTQQLQAMNQQMAAINQSMAVATTPAGPPMPQPTAVQQQQLLAQINQPQAQAAIQTAVQQAGPTIQKIVQFLACYPGFDPGKYLGEYNAPGGTIRGLMGPLPSMRYAPKTMCVNVVRMDNWQMPALNALSFRVVYQSSVSGETYSQGMTFQRQPDGTWMYLNVN